MKFLKTILTAVALLGAAFTSTAVAGPLPTGLTMHVDTSTETFWFTGTAYGTPSGDSEEGYVSWANSNYGSWEPLTAMDQFNSGNLYDATIYLSAINGGNIVIDLYFYSNSANFIEGTSEALSYSTLSLGSKTYLSTLTSINVNGGTGYGVMQVVQASAVPEPSTYAALFGATVLVAAVVRRKKRSVSEKIV